METRRPLSRGVSSANIQTSLKPTGVVNTKVSMRLQRRQVYAWKDMITYSRSRLIRDVSHTRGDRGVGRTGLPNRSGKLAALYPAELLGHGWTAVTSTEQEQCGTYKDAAPQPSCKRHQRRLVSEPREMRTVPAKHLLRIYGPEQPNNHEKCGEGRLPESIVIRQRHLFSEYTTVKPRGE